MRQEIINKVRAAYAGLYIQSFEEQRVEAELEAVAEAIGFGICKWKLTTGLVYGREQIAPGDPADMLASYCKYSVVKRDNGNQEIEGTVVPNKTLVVLWDFHQCLKDGNPFVTRPLKDALALAKLTNRPIIIVGCELHLPPEIEKEVAAIEFKLPTREELNIVLEAVAGSAGYSLNGNRETLLDAASGLTSTEAENAYAYAWIASGRTEINPAVVAREKASTVKKNGILEIVETQTGLADIGGLEDLKTWLSKRRLSFSKQASEFGLPVIKGCLAVGIPGCGKSLTAKAAANALGIPLLRLDAGKVFGSLVGESERNLRTAIATAEAVAPCVLFVDELEKAFAGSKSSGSTDGGTTARVFGTFLQWMNDKTSPVFVFATANDISALPPEFLRKGRFDEIWFVDLPTKEERAHIWAIQLAKRNRKPDEFDIESLSDRMTEGFTGAEIEACVNEALFDAFDAGHELRDGTLYKAIEKTIPLSRIMAGEIEALRQWANGRARRASPAEARALATTTRKLI